MIARLHWKKYIAAIARRGVVWFPTVSDDFNRADSAVTMGNTSVGNLPWVPTAVWGISGNQAYYVSGGSANNTIATVDIGASDVTITCTIPVWSASRPGIVARASDNANYFSFHAQATGYAVYRRLAGGISIVFGDVVPPVNGDVLQVICSGDNFTFKVNGVVKTTFSDSFNNTVTKHGLTAQEALDATARWDNFSVAPNS